MRSTSLRTLGLVVPLVLLVVSPARAVESRQIIDPPKIVHTGWSAETDPARAELISQLSAAKKRGDVAAALSLERQLAELAGENQPTVLPEGMPVEETPVIRQLGGRDGGGRWANNDVPVSADHYDEICVDLDGAQSGELVAAYEFLDADAMGYHRSFDGGETWGFWVGLSGGTTGHLTAAVGEGNEDWMVAAYVFDGNELWGWRESLTENDFSTPLIYNSGDGVSHPSITTDAAEYSFWYTYLVSNIVAPDGWAVCFTRSLDYGASWEAPPQVLHFYCEGWNASATRPDIAFSNGTLYIVYSDTSFPCSDSQQEVYVMTSGDFGVTWEGPFALTTSADLEHEPTVASVHDDTGEPGVVVTYSRYWDELDYDVWYAYSQDHGVSWNTSHCLSCTVAEDERSPNVETSFSNGRIHTAFWHDSKIDYAWAVPSAPTAWTFERQVNDGTNASSDNLRPGMAVNPTRPLGDEAGIAWTDNRNFAALQNDIYYDGPGTTTDAEEMELPDTEVLASCLPNPFSTETSIAFDLPRSGAVTLCVYDASGRRVRTLASGQLYAGHHVFDWQGTDQNGKRLGTGVYFLRLTGEGFVETRSVTLLR